jgi:hypothetical protein
LVQVLELRRNDGERGRGDDISGGDRDDVSKVLSGFLAHGGERRQDAVLLVGAVRRDVVGGEEVLRVGELDARVQVPVDGQRIVVGVKV